MSAHNIPFSIKKKITLYFSRSAAMGFFSKGLKNEFETAIEFKPLKFYCIYHQMMISFSDDDVMKVA